MEMSRDAGSIPAASTKRHLHNIVVSGVYYWSCFKNMRSISRVFIG